MTMNKVLIEASYQYQIMCFTSPKYYCIVLIVEVDQWILIPKGPNGVFCQHSNFWQLTKNKIFIFLL